MDTTSYKLPGTAANVDRDGKAAWNKPDSIKDIGTDVASVVPGKSTYTDWIRCTNFGFTSADVPEGATINGIELYVWRKAGVGATLNDSAIYLRNGAAAQVGNNKASATYYTTDDYHGITYGSSSDTWSASLTQADIVDTDFGVDISVNNPVATGNQTAFYDYVEIRITYTAGGAAGPAKLKTFNGLVTAKIKTINGLDIAKVKTINGLA